MLKILRHKNVSRFVLWGILILILPAFVIWGAGSVGRDKAKGPKYVGKIAGRNVTFEEFASSLASVRCQIFTNYFNNQKALSELMNNKSLIGKIAWDRIIMLKEARRLKIKADDKEVISYIRSHPLFLRNGVFDERMYDYILRNNIGLDARTFEEVVRENIAMQKMNDRLTRDIKVSDEELNAYYRAENSKFKVTYAVLAEGDNAKDEADAMYTRLSDTMAKDKKSFEDACLSLGLKTVTTPLFSKTDYVEALGEALPIAAESAGMKKDDVSGKVPVRRGIIIFKLIDEEPASPEKFSKDKEGYVKKLTELKKNMALEIWLRGLEQANTLNINLDEYDKYYR